MKISTLPWGILSHGGHSAEVYHRWLEFAGANPHVGGVDLIDGTGSLFGTPSRKKESRRFKVAIDDRGLNVVMLVSHTDFRDDAVGEAEESRIAYLIDQAAFFGATYFRVLTGISRPGDLFGPGIMENVVRGLGWCAGLVQDAGLRPILENHHETTDELLTLMTALAPRARGHIAQIASRCI